ncbi:MAG: thioredoxin domain-containing protein [Thermoplasmataceae archaeon]
MTEYTNRLIREKSPYLQQHAHNPVDWYPWGDEAFREAKSRNRPIFLSIGYSTCHWCHVMERESFEHPQVAEVLNRTFVCIKVDREERPDLDSTFMAVSQMMTGTGGWPLNIILTPDGVPVFALTYIPRESRGGQVGIIDLANQINELWTEGHEDVERRAQEVLSNLKNMNAHSSSGTLGNDIPEKVFRQMSDFYDSEYGGFGSSQKFPSPQNLMFLLRYYHRFGDRKALDMVTKTLNSMRNGGIFDHIGYGFHRYSTDPAWFLPHFEKMIYDQAYLMMAYTEAFQATGDHAYEDVVREIFSFLINEMSSPEGAYYSALDADSEGEEGKFYTWRSSEIMAVLGQEDAAIFMEVYNVDPSGNYLEEATGRSTGKNILHLTGSLDEEAERLGLSKAELQSRLSSMRARLLEYRSRRVRPHRDEKILADMNGLVIAALAKAYRATGDSRFLEASRKCEDFITGRMMKDGRLFHRFKDGEAAIPGYLDDYAFLSFGLIELFLSTMDAGYLSRAIEIANTIESHFRDSTDGGYYLAPDDGEKLLVRIKEGHDGSYPSGNSVQMLNLARMGSILSGDQYIAWADSIGQSFAKDISRSPMYFSFMALAIDYLKNGSYLVKTSASNPDAEKLRSRMWKGFYPDAELVITDSRDAELMKVLDEPVSAGNDEKSSDIMICTQMNCLPPSADVDAAIAVLEKKK